MSFATFDVALHCLLRKKARVQQFTKQITTIKKKKRANKFTKQLYKLVLSDKCILTYIETIYATKLRNRTISNSRLRDKSQDLRTIAIATSTTKLKIVFEVFQK